MFDIDYQQQAFFIPCLGDLPQSDKVRKNDEVDS